MTILTHGGRRDNATAIADARTLGYLPEPILDCTYHTGRFWRIVRPSCITRTDLDPEMSPDYPGGCDFRDLPYPDGMFASVVFDPPYKYSGTARSDGPAALNEGYGIGAYLTPDDRDTLIQEGMDDCARVLGVSGFLLVKVQDQIVSGRKRWQAMMAARHGEQLGLRLHDTLLVAGRRKQPEGRSQKHSHIDYSTLLIFSKAAR